ncbi:MAG: ATP-binding protein [Natrialbaceae archaeon]|nr:ATP-binding protein [Natrialbaceae archaeon]
MISETHLTLRLARMHAARETGEDVHFEKISEAHERIRTLIQDVMALVKGGDVIGEVEAISLETIARAAWESVQTGDATLEVHTDRRLLADPVRLQTLLENLFRNAIEHGRPPDERDLPFRVTVGDDGDGFFVADTGSGFSVDEPDQLVDPGETGTGQGTGLGLAIVDSIAGAHEWTCSISESAAGGARFTFDSVQWAE